MFVSWQNLLQSYLVAHACRASTPEASTCEAISWIKVVRSIQYSWVLWFLFTQADYLGNSKDANGLALNACSVWLRLKQESTTSRMTSFNSTWGKATKNGFTMMHQMFLNKISFPLFNTATLYFITDRFDPGSFHNSETSMVLEATAMEYDWPKVHSLFYLFISKMVTRLLVIAGSHL